MPSAIGASTTALMCMGPYGWAAAAVLQIANALGVFGSDRPPSATAELSIGPDGGISHEVHGDDAVREAADSLGGAMVETAEALRDAGVRIDFDGLPNARVCAGRVDMSYTSPAGFQTSVGTSMEESVSGFHAILIQRHCFDKIYKAENAAMGADGRMNSDKLTRELAKDHIYRNADGSYYTAGVPVGSASIRSSGVIIGEGSTSYDTGRVITAGRGSVRSLPAKPSPMPAREVQEITAAMDLGGNFHGVRADLTAVAFNRAFTI